MKRLLRLSSLAVLLAGLSTAAEVQGVIADWSCAQDMVRDGREKTLKNRRECSLASNINRSAYALITSDNKYYKIDPKDNDRVVQMLKDSPNKDTLKVVISGDIKDDTLSIDTISEL